MRSWQALAIALLGALVGSVVTLVLVDRSSRGDRDQAAELRRLNAELSRHVHDLRARPPELATPPSEDVAEGGEPGHPQAAGEPPQGAPPPQDTPTRPLPDRHDLELQKVDASLRANRVWGDTSTYSYRLQLTYPNVLSVVRGGAAPAGRMGPDSTAYTTLRTEPKEEWEEARSELWRLFEEENKALGRLGVETQRVIAAKRARGASEAGVIAGEVFEGRLCVVKDGEDREVDGLVEELERLRRRRIALIERMGK